VAPSFSERLSAHYMEASGQLHVPASLTPTKNSGTHLKGSRARPRAGLKVSEKRKISCLS